LFLYSFSCILSETGPKWLELFVLHIFDNFLFSRYASVFVHSIQQLLSAYYMRTTVPYSRYIINRPKIKKKSYLHYSLTYLKNVILLAYK